MLTLVPKGCLRKLLWEAMKGRKEPGPKKNAIAQAMVAMRNKKLTPARRKEIAKAAAQARWGKKNGS